MRRSDYGRINTGEVLEQASGRIHSPEDRFKTKGGVSGQDNETRTFSGAKGITGRPELGIGICVICETCPFVPRSPPASRCEALRAGGRRVCGLEGISQFKHKIYPRHGRIIGKIPCPSRRVVLIQKILNCFRRFFVHDILRRSRFRKNKCSRKEAVGSRLAFFARTMKLSWERGINSNH